MPAGRGWLKPALWAPAAGSGDQRGRGGLSWIRRPRAGPLHPPYPPSGSHSGALTESSTCQVRHCSRKRTRVQVAGTCGASPRPCRLVSDEQLYRDTKGKGEGSWCVGEKGGWWGKRRAIGCLASPPVPTSLTRPPKEVGSVRGERGNCCGLLCSKCISLSS